MYGFRGNGKRRRSEFEKGNQKRKPLKELPPFLRYQNSITNQDYYPTKQFSRNKNSFAYSSNQNIQKEQPSRLIQKNHPSLNQYSNSMNGSSLFRRKTQRNQSYFYQNRTNQNFHPEQKYRNQENHRNISYQDNYRMQTYYNNQGYHNNNNYHNQIQRRSNFQINKNWNTNFQNRTNKPIIPNQARPEQTMINQYSPNRSIINQLSSSQNAPVLSLQKSTFHSNQNQNKEQFYPQQNPINHGKGRERNSPFRNNEEMQFFQNDETMHERSYDNFQQDERMQEKEQYEFQEENDTYQDIEIGYIQSQSVNYDEYRKKYSSVQFDEDDGMSESNEKMEEFDSMFDDLTPLPIEQMDQKKMKISYWTSALFKDSCPTIDALNIYYKKTGKENLFEWQTALLEDVQNDEGHLVYSFPTSGGKTLISELLMFSEITKRKGKKALYLVPYNAIIGEKIDTLESCLEETPFRVGNRFPFNEKKKRRIEDEETDIIICTFERGAGIINKLIKMGKLDELAVVIIDEIHMIDDQTRGPILELLISKLLFEMKITKSHIRIIGMSATIPNLVDICNWIGARLFFTNKRPVNLKEYMVYDNVVYKKEKNNKEKVKVRTLVNDGILENIKNNIKIEKNDMHNFKIRFDYYQRSKSVILKSIITLIQETVHPNEDKSVLLFCGSRNQCESNAYFLAKCFNKEIITCKKDIPKRKIIIESLKASYVTDRIAENVDLLFCIRNGTGYHHAKLTEYEKEKIEIGYKNGSIKVLCATTTLAAGVNLPARRVIFLKSFDKKKNHNYHQACGRAGRAGYDDFGESFLITDKKNQFNGFQLLNSRIKAIISNLENSNDLALGILELICCKGKCSREELEEFLKTTFFYFIEKESSKKKIKETKNSAIGKLFEEGIIEETRSNPNKKEIRATKKGTAIFNSTFSIEDGLYVYDTLFRANQKMRLGSDFQATFCLTPFKPHMFFELFILREITCNGNVKQLRDYFYQDKADAIKDCIFEKQAYRDNPHFVKRYNQRVAQAVVLYDLLEEKSLQDIIKSYGLKPGEIFAFKRKASDFAYRVVQFCKDLNWMLLNTVLRQVAKRFKFFSKTSVVNLCTSIKELKPKEARLLVQGRITEVESIVETKDEIIADLLQKGQKFSSQHEYLPNGQKKPKKRRFNSSIKNREECLKRAKMIKKFAKEFLDSIEEDDDSIEGTPLDYERKYNPNHPTRYRTYKIDEFPIKCCLVNSAIEKTQFVEKLKSLEESSTLVSFEFHIQDENVNRIRTKIEDFEGIIFEFEDIVYYVNLSNLKDLEKRNFLTELGPFFTSTRQGKITSNVKWKAILLHHFEIELQNCHDPLLLYHVFNTKENSLTSLFSIFKEFHEDDYCKLLLKKSKKEKAMVISYLNKKAFQIVKKQITYSKENEDLIYKQHYKNSSLRLALLLARLEYTGISISNSTITTQKQFLMIKEEETEKYFYELVGKERISQKLINKKEEFGNYLFFTNQIPYRINRTKTGKFSVAKESLAIAIAELEKAKKNPRSRKANGKRYEVGEPEKFIEIIKTYSSYNKVKNFKSKYLNSGTANMYGEFDKYSNEFRKFFPYCQINSHGRLSAGIQNAQKDLPMSLKHRTYKGKSMMNISARAQYIPRKGYVFLSFDYSQIELRVYAVLSKDQEFLASFKTVDFLKDLASKAFNKRIEDVTEQERSIAKQVVYGNLYGMGTESLGKTLHISTEVAKNFKNKIFGRFQGLKKWTEDTISQSEKNSFAFTAAKRKLFLDMDNNKNKKGTILSVRINGTASDIFRATVLKLEKSLFKEFGKQDKYGKQDYYLVLLLHDEVMFEVKNDPEFIKRFHNKVKKKMSSTPRKEFPSIFKDPITHIDFPVKCKIGKRNWKEMTDFELFKEELNAKVIEENPFEKTICYL